MIKFMETVFYTEEKKLTIIESKYMKIEISSIKYDDYDETIIKDLGETPFDAIINRPANHDEAIKWCINTFF